MAENDPFWDAELKGRDEFKTLFDGKFQWMVEGKLSMPYDGIVGLYTNEIYPFEIKKRDFGFGKYPDYILEYAKAKTLLEAHKKNKQFNGAWYINILDDKMLIWDITKIDLGQTTKEHCPKTSAEGKKNYTIKSCYHLKPEDTIWMLDIS